MQRPLLLAIDRSATLLELREQAARATSNGFDGVEWSLPAGFALLPSSISHLASIPIRAVAMGCEMMDLLSAVQFLLSRLQAASSLEATVLNLSFPPVRRESDDEGFASYQDALNFAYELLHRVRFEAEAKGLTVALEAATGGCFLSPTEVRELVDAVNSSAIGVCLDVERLDALGSPIDWIHILHHRVRAVRFTDVSCSGGSAATQTNQSPMDLLSQALNETASNCPLILSHNSTKGRFAGKRCDG